MLWLNILTGKDVQWLKYEGRKDPVESVKGPYGRYFGCHATPQEHGLITVEPPITVLKRLTSSSVLSGPIRVIPLIRCPLLGMGQSW